MTFKVSSILRSRHRNVTITASMPRPKKSSIAKIEPIEKPRVNPVLKFVNGPENDYEKWLRKADKADSAGDLVSRDTNLATAYVTDEGFYHYCYDILGYKQMYKPFHGRMAKFIVGSGVPYYYTKRGRWLQGFRGSFKSSMLSVGYSTWLVAREYMLSQAVFALRSQIAALEPGDLVAKDRIESAIAKLVSSGDSLPGVNIRIGLASESLDLPSDHLRTCCAVMDSTEYVRFFGQHGPKDRRKGAQWGRSGVTSQFRSNKALRDPTIWSISLEAPRTGRHFDVILPDDLQAERSAASRNQLRETWRLYKLLWPLLDPPNISWYSEMVGGATRWHEQDIYGRQEQENEHRAPEDHIVILKLPVCNEAEVATCPTIYGTDEIQRLKSKGIDEFNTQYLLKPRSAKTSAFHREWIQYYDPLGGELAGRRDKGYCVTGADFAWVEAKRRGAEDADHSVVCTWRVIPGYHWYLVGIWRGQTTRLETLAEIQRQYAAHQSIGLGLSTSDKRHVEGDISRYETENRFVFNTTWVSDLSSYATGDDTHKNRKIIGTLQPLFQTSKVHIPLGLTWIEEEILDFPMGINDDFMDAFCCAVGAAMPPIMNEKRFEPEWSPGLMWQRHTEGLLKGRPIFLDGRPVRPPKSFRSPKHSTRRARNRHQ